MQCNAVIMEMALQASSKSQQVKYASHLQDGEEAHASVQVGTGVGALKPHQIPMVASRRALLRP